MWLPRVTVRLHTCKCFLGFDMETFDSILPVGWHILFLIIFLFIFFHCYVWALFWFLNKMFFKFPTLEHVFIRGRSGTVALSGNMKWFNWQTWTPANLNKRTNQKHQSTIKLFMALTLTGNEKKKKNRKESATILLIKCYLTLSLDFFSYILF